MGVWILVPVKPLGQAKTRLAGVLSGDQRKRLAGAMLRRTLKVVVGLPQVVGTLVISRDATVRAIARDLGAHTLNESGPPALNSALEQATQTLINWRAEAVLILPADLPLINRADLSAVIERGGDPNTVVIGTDHEGNGTNIMLVRPVGLFSYAYGENSYEQHIRLAKAAGAEVKYCELERLQLDVDLPPDLARYQQYVDDGRFGAVSLLTVDGKNEIINDS